MQFKNSKHFSSLKHNKIETPFGVFYFCDKYIISEVYEDLHVEWEYIEILINEVFKFYGESPILGYISNRVNDYSIDPQNWVKILDKYDNFLVASAVITYNRSSYKIATLEKHFSQNRLRRFTSLDEAINWMENVKELKTS